MTAREVFEEFCKLPGAEQYEVVAYLQGLQPSADGRMVDPDISTRFNRMISQSHKTKLELPQNPRD